MGYRMRHDVETYDIAGDMYRKPTTSHTEHTTSEVVTYDIYVTYDIVYLRYRRTYDIVYHDIVGHNLQYRTDDIVGS